jgi:cbb3-type cytochrome oxidase subunit 1
VIFAFGGNALIATSFYVVQRTCRARLFGGARLVRVLGLPAVHRHGGDRLSARHHPVKEYAEPEWYVDLWLTVVWVAYLLVFLARCEAQGAAHLRRQLVLPGLHRDHRDAASRQQPGGAGVDLGRRATRSPACRTR